MTKMTKKNVFEALINYAETGIMTYEGTDGAVTVDAAALKTFAEHEIALLEKKAAKAKDSADKRKAASDELTEAVAAILTDDFQTIAEVTDQLDDEDITTSKVQYRLNALVKAGRAEKSEITIAASEGKKRKVMAYKVAVEQ